MKFPTRPLKLTQFHPYWKELISEPSLRQLQEWNIRAEQQEWFRHRLQDEYTSRFASLILGLSQDRLGTRIELEKFYLFLYAQSTLDTRGVHEWLRECLRQTEGALAVDNQ